MFHYFVISFGFSGLKCLFLKEINSNFALFSNPVSLILCYFNEFICILSNPYIEKYYLTLVNKLVFQNSLLNIHISIIDKNSLCGFDFLDWHFKCVTKKIYTVVPAFDAWLSYKNQFKRILKSNSYTIYQRVKFLQILTQMRIKNNWFCSYLIFRKEFYVLKIWFNNYLRQCTILSKHEKNYLLEFVFKV
jgi:hypothetical protein